MYKMLRKLGKGRKRGGRRRVARRGRRVPRALGSGNQDFARVTANLGQVNIGANIPFTMNNFALSNSQRACAVAAGYQYYRVKRVIIKVKPLYDTFQLGGQSTVTLPYLYYMIDRHNTFPVNTTVQTLKAAGCKPRRLDDKTITISFKPSVVNSTMTAVGAGSAPPQFGLGTYRISPWLSTNGNNNGSNPGSTGVWWKPDSTDHQGLILFVEQYSVPTPNVVCTLEYMIEYEFKKRLWEPPASQVDLTVNSIDLDTLTISEPPVFDNGGGLSQA